MPMWAGRFEKEENELTNEIKGQDGLLLKLFETIENKIL